jgi:O-acetyl-ADP-ribose deacetylase (regulator of RNase III)
MLHAPDSTDALTRNILNILGDHPLGDAREARTRVQALLTRVPPGELPEAVWPLLESLWQAETHGRQPTVAFDLPRLAKHGWASRVSLWRGDITTLAVQAIVNAANSGLTGCYHPMHACVDNAIHTAAGPWLREACGRIMAERGRPESTATATLTPGFFLPAAHVLHTVGPIVHGGRPSLGDERDLSQCYTACCEAAVPWPAGPMPRNLAFCSISTGVFGYPIAQAAPRALATVRAVLEREPSLEQVVFVTYSAHDAAVYAAAAQEALHV